MTANKIGGAFALQFTLVDSVPKTQDGAGWLGQALGEGRSRDVILVPTRRLDSGVASTILRGPIDELGMSLGGSYGGSAKGPDHIDRLVTILIKPAPGATALP